MKYSPNILEKLPDSWLQSFSQELYILRLDQIHPFIGGNKYFKLLPNLKEAKAQEKSTILTFGGAFSNHIYATAAAGKLFGLKTIGVIRGESHKSLNATLDFAQSQGMHLHYMDRETYRKKNEAHIIEHLKNLFGDFYLIPEGGSNALAVKGCQEIYQYLPPDFIFDYICCPCGTGGTLAGLIVGLSSVQMALGFSALKGDFLENEVQKLIQAYALAENISLSAISENWSMLTDYHFGGYAKKKPELIHFIEKFQNQNHIPIEWIYSGKMFYGIYDLLKKGFFPPQSKILALHTGGIR